MSTGFVDKTVKGRIGGQYTTTKRILVGGRVRVNGVELMGLSLERGEEQRPGCI